MSYQWENPATGLNRLRITAMSEAGLFNTVEQEITVPHPANHKITVSQDTYIRGFHKRYSTKNFNELKVLEAKTGGPRAIRHIYLLFDLESLPNQFESCYLKLKQDQNSDFLTNKCILYGIEDDSWKESTLTWDSAPS